MKYPDKLTIYLRDPKPKFSSKRLEMLRKSIHKFGRVLVSRAIDPWEYSPRGIDYKIENTKVYNDQIIIKLVREDLDDNKDDKE